MTLELKNVCVMTLELKNVLCYDTYSEKCAVLRHLN
jgi:hypothetical protein